jgi:periplasmic protein TonB
MTPKDFRQDIAISRARAQRMMAVSTGVHVLIVAWLVLFPPAPREHWDPVTEIAVINHEDLLAPEPEPLPATPEEAAPAGPESVDPEPAPGPVEPAPAPDPEPAPAPRMAHRAEAGPAAPAPPPPPPAPRVESGARGRARAAEVAEAVQAGDLLRGVDNMMDGIKTTAPAGTSTRRGTATTTRAASAALSSAAGRESGADQVGQAAAGAGQGIGAGALTRSSVMVEDIALGGGGGGGGGGTGTGGGGGAGGSGDAGDSRSIASLMAVVHRYAGGIKYCYDRCLESRPEVKGRMVLLITVAPNGTVSKLQPVANTVKDDALEGCVLGQVKAWKFPASSGPAVSFRCPLVFTPPAP